MKKRLLASVLVSVICVGSVAGCNSSEASDVQTVAAQTQTTQSAEQTQVDKTKYEVTKPMTIKWWHALEDQYSGVLTEVVDKFEASQDLIKVEPVYIGNYSTLNEQLVLAHQSGTDLPGVAVANTPYIAEYGAGGLTENLIPYIQATDFDIDDFGTGLIKASSYEDQQVSLPFLISTQVMYYNVDMAKKLGVTVPTKWSDMTDFLQKTTQKNPDGTTSVYGTIIPGWDQWYFETFYLNRGINIINKEGKTTDLDSEVAVDTAKTFQSWCDNGLAYWATGTDASSIMRGNFVDGKAFSVIHTSSLYDSYVNKCDFEVGMAWLPGDVSSNSEIGGCVLLMPSKNNQEVKNASWQFLQFLCSKDINMLWAEKTGYMPTRNSVLQTDEGKAFLKEKPAFKAIFDNLDLINPRIQHTSWSALCTVWKNYMSEAITEKLDMQERMKAMTIEINEVLQDQ